MSVLNRRSARMASAHARGCDGRGEVARAARRSALPGRWRARRAGSPGGARSGWSDRARQPKMPASRSRTGALAIRAPSAASSGSSPQRRVRSARTPAARPRSWTSGAAAMRAWRALSDTCSSCSSALHKEPGPQGFSLTPTTRTRPSGSWRVAFELGGMGDDHQAVVEIDDRSFLQVLVGDLLVDRLALLELAGLAGIVEPLIDVLAAEVPIVLRRAALVEDVAVAVGIDAARSSR